MNAESGRPHLLPCPPPMPGVTEYGEIWPVHPGYYVYRCWAADKECLYVGAAGTQGKPVPVTQRLYRHAREAPWFPAVTVVDIASLASSRECVAEERAQIQRLRPTRNKAMRVCRAALHDVTAPGTQTSDGKCRECTNARMQVYLPQWRAANPGKDAEYQARQRDRLGEDEWNRRHTQWSRDSRARQAILPGQPPLF